MRPLLQLIPGGYSGPNGRSGGLTKDEVYEPPEEVVHTVCTPIFSIDMTGLLTLAAFAKRGQTNGARPHNL